MITNCAFGDGHGVSIGSYTSGGVSNLLVASCTFSNTDQGIRIKSDRDRGGVVQNLTYCNLSMSNVTYPILIYAAYTNTSSTFKAVNNLTPAIAATYPANALLGTTPIYRDIVISNVTGTAQSGRIAGLIWGLPEMLVSNIVLANVTLAGSKPFGVYYASGVQFIDSQITTPAGVTNVSFYNSQLLFSNSFSAKPALLDGFSTSGIQNELSFLNTPATLLNTNALGANPHLALAGSVFTLYNNLHLGPDSLLSFVLGSSPATIQVAENLTTAGAVSISAGPGFTNGSYTLLTYGQHLDWTPPTLETLPPGHNYAWDTNTPNQVRLLVNPLVSLVPTNISFLSGGGQLRLEWPADHLGWHLAFQTNSPGQGLGTNWTEWPDSAGTNVVIIPFDSSFGSAFFRLKYP